MPESIGFIGLGDLGRPIATNLLAAGYPLTVHNRTPGKADALVAKGATRAERPVDAVKPGGIVVSLLWDDASVESVVNSDDFLARLGPGGVHVSMSTLSPAGSRKLADLHAGHGSSFVEAPIFGRPEAAEAKKLWIVQAGPIEAKQRVRPVLDAMGAQGVFDFGEDIGAATTVKLIGNFLMFSEGLTLARKNGVDPQSVVDMLTGSIFPAPIYKAQGSAIAAGMTPPQSSIPDKDLALFKAAAESVASPTDVADLLRALRGK
jgi:3-hydroxyisobutyrate dehydrogenase-like beta-hydroxyacid dehydrogenase